jgi:Fic family protein
MLRVYKLLQSTPLITIPRASQKTAISVPIVTAALSRMEELGIVREITSKRRDKLYSYEKYIQLLNEGTEPING